MQNTSDFSSEVCEEIYSQINRWNILNAISFLCLFIIYSSDTSMNASLFMRSENMASVFANTSDIQDIHAITLTFYKKNYSLQLFILNINIKM